MFVRGCRLMLSVERVTSRDELHDDEPLALCLEDVLEGHDVRVTPHAAVMRRPMDPWRAGSVVPG